jgi:hypothetical protein
VSAAFAAVAVAGGLVTLAFAIETSGQALEAFFTLTDSIIQAIVPIRVHKYPSPALITTPPGYCFWGRRAPPK